MSIWVGAEAGPASMDRLWTEARERHFAECHMNERNVSKATPNSSRRQFCRMAAVGSAMAAASAMGSFGRALAQGAFGVHFSVGAFDRERILRLADAALGRSPLKLSDVPAPGNRDAQDFYSEQRLHDAEDGTGSTAFFGHVDLLVEMNRNLSALTAAWRLTAETRYFDAALRQMQVWFVDRKTRMLPTQEHAGVVPGIEDDRNNGLDGTVALAECARASAFLCAAPQMPANDAAAVKAWFVQMLEWLVESKKGDIARQSKALPAICWSMQAAEFARFVQNDTQYRACAHLFRESLLRQMNFEGFFPPALRDQNPYALSMFTLECLGAACESLSTPFQDLWTFNLPDGRGMHSALAWAMPFLRDRAKWPYVSDRENFKAQPQRENALLFAGRAFNQMDYIELWKALPTDASARAVQRLHPVTQPVLWATRVPS